MTRFTILTRHRYMVSLVLALFLIALVAIVATVLRREHAAGLSRTGRTRLAYTGVAVSLPGQPFGVVATPDSKWLLVSITANSSSATTPDGLAVLRRHGETMSLVRVVDFIPGSWRVA